MKYLSFLLPGCFLLINTPAFTQNTSTWFPPGAKWSYSFHNWASNSDGEEYLELVGYETIGGELCAKLHYYAFDDFWGFPLPYDNGFKYFFARNDSVFLWNNNAFKLLYDFNRIAGDTLSLPSNVYDQGVVISVDNSFWQGIPIRVQHVRLTKFPAFPGGDTLYFDTQVYERLGGNHLIYWDSESPQIDIQYFFGCYSNDEHPPQNCPLGYDPTYTRFRSFGNPVWSEKDASWCGFRGYQYKMTADTGILGVGQGKKIYFRNTYVGSDPCPNGYVEILHEPFRLIGLLDEDFKHKKVYFARLTNDPIPFPACVQGESLPLNQFTLLYDFDLKVGDTLSWKPQPNVVQAIDSIQLDDGSWRRTFVFDTDNHHYWMEGIGSNLGLFGALADVQITDVACQLKCFREYNQVLYSTGDAIFCDSVSVATNEPHSLDKLLQLYPNPSTGKITLEIPQSETPAILRVFDLQGRELGQLEAPEAQNELDLSIWKNYPALFVQIRGAGGHYAARVVLLE